MLAAMFISGGADAVRNPDSKAKLAEKVTRPLSQNVAFLPDETTDLVRLNGGVQVVAGVLLSIGKLRRLSALALAASIIPTTLAGHRFWEEVDDDARAQQRAHFLKNLGLLGGLLLAVSDTEGAPSTTWKVRHRVRRTRRDVAAHTSGLDQAASRTLKHAADAGSHVWHKLDEVAAKEGPKVVEAASQYLSSGADFAGHLVAQAQDRLATL